MAPFEEFNNIINYLPCRIRCYPNYGYVIIVIGTVRSQKWIHVFCLSDAIVLGEFEIHSEMRGCRFFRRSNEPFACYIIIIVPN